MAVIDDGVYTGHPDLDSNIWINNGDIEGNGKDDDHNGYIDDRWGWNFIANSKDMTTLGTHGTMVAGIIGAESNNNTGISGINWNVKLMPVIACNNSGCGDQAITSAVKYAVDNGADIINLSLAGSVFNYTDDFNTAIKYAFDRNVLVVVAAGNGDVEGGIGRNLNTTKVSPVCNDGNENMVLGVGAINANNQITSWSNYGNCVDVYAPGENIVSTAVPAHSTLSGFYDTADGTSFSTPIVSGIAALIKAKYPEIKNTAIRDRIINNSDNQNNINIVNAHKAISQAFTDNEKKTGSAINPTPIATDPATGDAKNLQNKLKGYILLQVESHGEAWYVNPVDGKRYYMKDGATAYEMMRKFGLGITNTDLGKLPQENQRNNNPSLVNKLKGKILLQVQSLGEAWYINPKTGFRYYMKNGEAAYNLMRNYSLGITNKDLEKIPIGNF
ncbi:MAG: S8 family serine peptidase [Patescibacteria group bacterium]